MAGKLVLIDGHSILNRAFYGLPDLTNAEGIHTGAVYGFLNIMFRIVEEEKPDYFVKREPRACRKAFIDKYEIRYSTSMPCGGSSSSVIIEDAKEVQNG